MRSELFRVGLFVVLSSTLWSCDDEPSNGDSGTETYTSCPQVESALVQSLDDSSATVCAANAGCFFFEGLCNATDGRADDARALSTAIEPDIVAMSAAWDEMDCQGTVRCNGGSERAFCINEVCVTSFDCDRVLDSMCSSMTGSCGSLFEGSNAGCAEEVMAELLCDPEGADPTEAATCLSGISPDCASVDAAIDSVVTACGQNLGWHRQ